MSRAIQDLKDFLAKSPSVVFPDEVLEYVDAIEAENDKLRELVQDFDKCLDAALYLAHGTGHLVMPDQKLFDSLRPRMRDLGIEVRG